MLLFYVATAHILATSAADIFYGQGRFLYSYSWDLGSTYFYGIEISYRPQNYQTYSSGPNGIVGLVKMVYDQDYTFAGAEQGRDRQYYYYTVSSGASLELGQYLSITIEMYGQQGETIYRERRTSAVTGYSGCNLDIGIRNSTKYYCSDKFSDESKWSDNFQQQTTDSVTASNDRPTTDPATDIWVNDSLTTVVSDIWSNDSLTTTQAIAHIISTPAADTFYGQGRFLYSYSWDLGSTYFYGIEISYRPQNYQTYSSGPNGIVGLVKMVYDQDYTFAGAEQGRDSKSIASRQGKLMTWSEAGQYYYYTDSDESINLGQYLSITIEMYGQHGETIYHESKTSAVTEYSNCKLDIGTRSSSKYYCSAKFGDESKWSSNFQKQTTDSVTESNDRASTGTNIQDNDSPTTESDIWGNDRPSTGSDIWSTDSPTTTEGNSDNDGESSKGTKSINTEKEQSSLEAVVISKGGLAAAISVPMIIVIVIAVVVVWILWKKRASNDTGNQVSYLSSRHQDNKVGRVGPAFTQSSAELQIAIQGSEPHKYETPMQPQAENIYDTLGDNRPPPPTPSAPYMPSQHTMHYSSKPYCYVGPEQDQAPRKATPPRPVLSAVDESDIYIGPKQMDPSREFETQRYDDATIHGYDDAIETGEEDCD